MIVKKEVRRRVGSTLGSKDLGKEGRLSADGQWKAEYALCGAAGISVYEMKLGWSRYAVYGVVGWGMSMLMRC